MVVIIGIHRPILSLTTRQ